MGELLIAADAAARTDGTDLSDHWWVLLIAVAMTTAMFAAAYMGSRRDPNACPACNHSSRGVGVCKVDDELSGWKLAEPCQCDDKYHRVSVD